MAKTDTRFLESKQQISEYLHNASDYLLKKYIKLGMPVLIIDGQWMAYADNLDAFWQQKTRVKAVCSEEKKNEENN